MPNPIKLLREAIDRIPSLKYALGIVGICAAFAIITSLIGGNLKNLMAIFFAILVLMVVLYVVTLVMDKEDKVMKFFGYIIIFTIIFGLIGATGFVAYNVLAGKHPLPYYYCDCNYASDTVYNTIYKDKIILMHDTIHNRDTLIKYGYVTIQKPSDTVRIKLPNDTIIVEKPTIPEQKKEIQFSLPYYFSLIERKDVTRGGIIFSKSLKGLRPLADLSVKLYLSYTHAPIPNIGAYNNFTITLNNDTIIKQLVRINNKKSCSLGPRTLQCKTDKNGEFNFVIRYYLSSKTPAVVTFDEYSNYEIDYEDY